MRFFVPLLILLAVNALADVYIYFAILSDCRNRLWARLQMYTAIALAALLLFIQMAPIGGAGNGMFAVLMWSIFTYISIYAGKYIYIITDVLSRIPRLLNRRQWRWLQTGGALLGCALCCIMWWGALCNRFNIDVVHENVSIAGLPEQFDGFRIAQISDLHVGTFGNDISFLTELVDSVNAQRPDLIVFTGDIVNRRSDELLPFTRVLAGLHAPAGVLSIMGNHDYGDYSRWSDSIAKAADVEAVKRIQTEMGWRMLNNSAVWLRKGSDSIAVIGVENVGDPPFTIYGDLRKAYPDISDNNTKILLSHNPAHWTDSISGNPSANIALTLSGHTHAMQIRILGWSPAQWRYPIWGGPYADNLGHQLYVNIGAGTVGLPSRIGATPEITVITLHRD